MIRIGIAEDQALVRESLSIVLGLEKDMEVAWQAATGNEAVRAVMEKAVDVVLMDLRMPEMDGVAATMHIGSLSNECTIIVLTTFDHDEWILDAIHAGAECCFLKDIPPGLLIKAIRLILSDRFDLQEWSPEWRLYAPEIQVSARIRSSQIAGRQVRTGEVHLTPREWEILRRISQNQTNTEMAKALFLTQGTIKNYVSQLYMKIGVSNRAEAIRYALGKGIL
ncbi:response regulator transcription factor [Heyndrickxia acidicola]|uniref:Response regulator transcription factor n=1 Tax=Heyndrickxia acidicola TaxID=209389 RepID=A0ABU6MIY5_9BACI|nr:response regulator transcription factor [Heyndrickxia acidicola]MED1204627.1 response regulator transcription factor [Heyndrickxia acidicola]